MDRHVGSKNSTNECLCKTEIDSQTQKTNLGLPKGKRGRRDKLGEFGISTYKLLYTK